MIIPYLQPYTAVGIIMKNVKIKMQNDNAKFKNDRQIFKIGYNRIYG